MRIERSSVILLIVSLAVALGSAANATSALPSIEEQMLRGAVIVMCHTIQSDEDRAYLDLDEAVGRASFERIWGELNIADPSALIANGRKAEELFRHRLLEAAENAQKQVKEKGCAAMERQTAPASQ
jgi:hypothetical protein